jgi:hypothetical protein
VVCEQKRNSYKNLAIFFGKVTLSVVFVIRRRQFNTSLLIVHLQKKLWRIVHMTFTIMSPSNINNMFGNWLNGITKKDKGFIRVGVCALLWEI